MFRSIRAVPWLTVVLACAEITGEAEPLELERALAKRVSFETGTVPLLFVIPRLEKLVQQEFPDFEIKIILKDMEREGITKRGAGGETRFDDTSVADVLTALVMRDNPIQPITDPRNPDQKVVWTVDTTNQPNRRIVITTRAAAKKYGDKLPEVFKPKAKAE